MNKIKTIIISILLLVSIILCPINSNALPELYEVVEDGFFGILDFGIIPDVMSIILNGDKEKLDLLLKCHRVVLIKHKSVFLSDSKKDGIMFGVTSAGPTTITVIGPSISCQIYKPKNKKDKDA
jgi:hypothetical protein